MRGLIEKDLRLTLTRKSTILIFFLMALVMSFSMDGAFLVAYVTMLSMVVSVGTISYDEFDNGFAFLMTLPFSRKTYVIEKYLFCLMTSALAWCAGVVLYLLGSLLRHQPITLAADLPMLLSVLPTIYMSAAILIPLQLKYGAEKSRVVLAILFGAIAVGFIGIKSMAGNEAPAIHRLVVFLDTLSPWRILLVFVAVSAAVARVCCLISVGIMQKKEF